MKEYNISKETWEECKAAGEARHERGKRMHAKHTRNYSDKRDDYILNNTISYGGELAAAKFLNITPQTGLHGIQKADILYRGLKVDVKTSKTPYMCIGTGSLNPEWIYLYVRYEEPSSFKVVGYMPGNLVTSFPLRDFENRNSPCYSIPSGQLKPIEELKGVECPCW